MKNWKINYYKNLKKFAEEEIKKLEEKGFKSDKEPFEAYLSNYLKQGNSIHHKETIHLYPRTSLRSFPDTLRIFNPNEGHKAIGCSKHTFDFFKFKYRRPSINKAKEYIKMFNGSLIMESFYNKVDDFSHINK